MTTDDVVLACAGTSARISTLGAELRSWRVNGEELMWSGDPAIWDAVSPVLFPIVGATRNGILVEGRRYPLQPHGFARFQRFEVETSRADFARLTLRDNAETRAVYPFGFRLALEYRLAGACLSATIEVENCGSGAMPYACGLHPGFAWPGRPGGTVIFEREERPEVPRIAPGGLIGHGKRRLPLLGKELPLDEHTLGDGALCFLHARSRSLKFEFGAGPKIEMNFSDFAHCALWTKSGAPFVSVEVWTGYADPEGFDGDITRKPSIRMAGPRERASHRVDYRFQPASRGKAEGSGGLSGQRGQTL